MKKVFKNAKKYSAAIPFISKLMVLAVTLTTALSAMATTR